jgi:hypothetical protein
MTPEYIVNAYYTFLLKLQQTFLVTAFIDDGSSLLTLAVFWDVILCISFCCLYLHPNLNFKSQFTSETLITFLPDYTASHTSRQLFL